MRHAAWVVGITGALSAACGGPARVSDAWVVAAGPQGAGFTERARPTEGAPLLASGARSCLPDVELRSALGEVCDHESENRAQPPSGDLEPGIPPPTPEVRWYCGGRVAVRVVF